MARRFAVINYQSKPGNESAPSAAASRFPTMIA
jgi:hypothetical protein